MPIRTLAERCRVYCACPRCSAYPHRQEPCNWTQSQLDQCRRGQFEAVIQREIQMSKGTD